MSLGIRVAVKRQLTGKTFISGLLCCIAALSFTDAKAADRQALENDLRNIYEHKLLSLRQPCLGSKLKFDSSGTMVSKAVTGPWSTSGLMQIENLALTPEHLEIDGRRVILALRTRDVGTHTSLLPSDVGVTPLVTNDRVRVSIDLSASDVSQVNRALSQVFQGGQLMDRVAAYWQPKTVDLKAFRNSTPNAVVAELEGNRPVYLANSGRIGPPKPIDMPDPTYTKEARQKGLEGTVILLVAVNEKGFPEVLEVTRSLSEDLDTQALAAVAQWRFRPAVKDGQPVAVLINVEVTFRL
jgi:TonB family protein